VQLTEYVPGFGHTVVVDHGSYLTVYAHLSGIRVNRGDPVVAGGVVGLVGNSGLTEGDGYMLTFQVRYNGTPQDPLLWLERR
jgi:murein DD-endopeptidase MepM/ murein hydrolase activator NlpD